MYVISHLTDPQHLLILPPTHFHHPSTPYHTTYPQPIQSKGPTPSSTETSLWGGWSHPPPHHRVHGLPKHLPWVASQKGASFVVVFGCRRLSFLFLIIWNYLIIFFHIHNLYLLKIKKIQTIVILIIFTTSFFSHTHSPIRLQCCSTCITSLKLASPCLPSPTTLFSCTIRRTLSMTSFPGASLSPSALMIPCSSISPR